MKKMTQLLTVFALTLTAFSANAHEGHDHDAPKGLVAPKGGQIKATELTLIEVVARGKNVKIYLYDKDLKPQDAALYNVKAEAEKPRTKKREPITLTLKDGAAEASYDAKGAHRYTLHVTLKDPKEDHSDTVKFTVEPKK